MYGFNKVKNDKGIHEFKHPQFKKGQYEELSNIKRKNILLEKDDESKDNELDEEEFVKLKDKLDGTKLSLENVTQQNMNLISANKEVANQLYNFKQDYENRLSKFFYMFYFLINCKNEGILNILKKTLKDLGMSCDEDFTKSIEQRTLEAAEFINDKLLINNNSDYAIMNKLFNTFTFFFNVSGQNINDIFNSDNIDNESQYKLEFENIKQEIRPLEHTFINSIRNDENYQLQNRNNWNNGIVKYTDMSDFCIEQNIWEPSSVNDISVNQPFDSDFEITVQEEN